MATCDQVEPGTGGRLIEHGETGGATILFGIMVVLAGLGTDFLAKDGPTAEQLQTVQAAYPEQPVEEIENAALRVQNFFRAFGISAALMGVLQMISGVALLRGWCWGRSAVLVFGVVASVIAIWAAGSGTWALVTGDFSEFTSALLPAFFFGAYGWCVLSALIHPKRRSSHRKGIAHSC